MYVLDDVGFICHPNTGSRSLKTALMDAGAWRVKSHHKVCVERLARTRACVCVVRNPFDIMASWYCRDPNKVPFAHWLAQTLQGDRKHEGPQPCGLFYGLNWATHVIKFENLQSELNVTSHNLGLPRLILGDDSRSGRTSADYRALYDQRTKSMIRAAYGIQIQACNYGF
jgi:hypothetical protein